MRRSVRPTRRPVITFELKDDGAKIFGDYTAATSARILAIVLDNQVLSAPSINSAIPEGSGEITGQFTLEEANNLAVQMRYGALPVPLEVVNRSTIGATLGADSVQQEHHRRPHRPDDRAGLHDRVLPAARPPGGAGAVALRGAQPGDLQAHPGHADACPASSASCLSTGMAVDANILIFERMKEELRWGKSLRQAVEAGFDRAWTSILDSNLSTLIICVILILFGRTFGAQSVLGFRVEPGHRCVGQHVHRSRRDAHASCASSSNAAAPRRCASGAG